MQKNVRCNVEDHRLFDNGYRCEDVTSFTPPTIEHPTSEIKTAGLLMDIDMPNIYHFNAMEFSIAHNNGNNCSRLQDPGVHRIEGRVARQNYVTAQAELDLEVIKIRVTGVHKSTEKGDIESGNPYGSTEKFSIVRYEEEIGGEVVTLIDSTAGRYIVNGVDYSDRLASLLD